MGNELVVAIVMTLMMSLIIYSIANVADFVYRLKEAFSTKLSIIILLISGLIFDMFTLKILLGY